MRDAWYPVIHSKQLKPRRVISARLFGDPIALFRGAGGRPSCFLDSCPHRSIPFSLGRVVNQRLECAYHGWQFGSDGRCAHIPLKGEAGFIPRTATARVYPTMERHDVIWVWPGDPARASEADFALPFHTAGNRVLTHKIRTTFKSRYDLVIDHGLDMPHFFQLHLRTLVGFNPPLRAGFPSLEEIEEDETTLTMRWRLKWRNACLTVQAFHPCNIFTDLPINASGTRSMHHVVFFTPNDRENTSGFLFVYRNFLMMPIVKQLFDPFYAWVMAKGRAEDDEIFAGQLANEKLGAQPVTGWSYDVVARRYADWQRRRSSQDMWFKDLHHARRRYHATAVASAPPSCSKRAPR